jgi:hypothetical protein
VLCTILTVNSDYFLKQRQPVDLYNGEVRCFLCGTDWILVYYLDELQLQESKLQCLVVHKNTEFVPSECLVESETAAVPRQTDMQNGLKKRGKYINSGKYVCPSSVRAGD